ncbi:hypothetical protein PR048_020106 [Dryococelus australis]|uniref:Mutator-like transposase domain-containing protein n=1 Tax=Dryococelus australis TaxID=614101 RepID=A0ABQ9H5D0_9NEOP|nr:hypothetical protein PR048_020106 [Dryococelus australis]
MNGVPYITAIGDGGDHWPKNQNIILFLCVKNKHCSIFSVLKKKNRQSSNCVCYKNHTGPSTAMEKDLIAEGFNKSVAMHGINYRNYVWDGDAAMWLKAFCENLHKLASNKLYDQDARKILTRTGACEKISRVERIAKDV